MAKTFQIYRQARPVKTLGYIASPMPMARLLLTGLSEVRAKLGHLRCTAMNLCAQRRIVTGQV